MLNIKVEQLEEAVFNVEIQGLDSFLTETGDVGRVALMQLFSDITQRLVVSQITHHEAPDGVH